MFEQHGVRGRNSRFSLQLKTSLLTSISTAPHPGIYWGKNPPISRHMQFKPELFKAQVYTDAYNQSTKWQRCRRPREQSELWLSSENSLCFASLFLLMSVWFFLVSLVLPTVPWHRQLWIHILEFTIWWIQFPISGLPPVVLKKPLSPNCLKKLEEPWFTCPESHGQL